MEIDQVLVVREAERRARRDGGEYLRLVLGDRTGAAPAMVWEDLADAEAVARAGEPVHVRGRYAVHPRFGPQINLRDLAPAQPGSYVPADLLDGPAREAEQMERDLRELRRDGPASPTCARCWSACSARTRRAVGRATATAPAAKYYHQAYRHGLLEHCLGVAQAVSAISATFRDRPRRRRHRRAAARHRQARSLHASEPASAIDLTDAGRLQGEIALGYYRVRRVIEEIEGFPAELPQALLHIILSHHGIARARQPGGAVHARGDARAHGRQPRRAARQLRPPGEGACARPRAGRSFDRAHRRRGLSSPRARRRSAGATGGRAGTRSLRARRPESSQIAERSVRGAAPPHPRLLWLGADGEGHREADPPALADLLPDGRAPAGHGARHQARRRGLQRHERGRVRAALLRRPRRARVAAHPADRREARRRGRRAGELLAAAGELPPAPRSSSPTRSSRRCRPRCSCSTASSPTPSRCGWRCSRSPGDGRARCARPSSARSRSASPRRPAATSSPRAWRRSRRRSSATRRSPSTTTRWSATRSAPARVDPYHLLFQGGQFYLLGYAHEREAMRVFRLSRIRGKVAYATKAEHDFRRPADFDPRAYANLADWQFGESAESPRSAVRADRLAARAPLRPLRRDPRASEEEARELDAPHPAPLGAHGGGGGRAGQPPLPDRLREPAQLVSWVLGLGENARLSSPPELAAELARRVELLERRHLESPLVEGEALAEDEAPAPRAGAGRRAPPPAGCGAGGLARRRGRRGRPPRRGGDPPRALRPPGHAREHPDPGRPRRASGCRSPRSASACRSPTRSCARTSACSTSSTSAAAPTCSTPRSTRRPRATIEVDPEPYSDNFDRPARLLPVEAKALVAAIDLIGEHVPQGSLASRAREDRRRARRGPDGAGPAGRPRRRRRLRRRARDLQGDRRAPAARARLLQGERGRVLPPRGRALRADQRPRGLVRGLLRPRARGRAPLPPRPRSGAPSVSDEHFEPRPEVDPSADVDGWLRTGEVSASRTARVWVSPERARWARESAASSRSGTTARSPSSSASPASTGSCARCSRRRATRPCSSPRTPARRCWPRPRACGPPRRWGEAGRPRSPARFDSAVPLV